MDLLDVHCNGVLCSLGNDSTVGLTQFDESKGGCGGVGVGGDRRKITQFGVCQPAKTVAHVFYQRGMKKQTSLTSG